MTEGTTNKTILVEKSKFSDFVRIPGNVEKLADGKASITKDRTIENSR